MLILKTIKEQKDTTEILLNKFYYKTSICISFNTPWAWAGVKNICINVTNKTRMTKMIKVWFSKKYIKIAYKIIFFIGYKNCFVG